MQMNKMINSINYGKLLTTVCDSNHQKFAQNIGYCCYGSQADLILTGSQKLEINK